MRKGLSAILTLTAGLAPFAAMAAASEPAKEFVCDTAGYKPLGGLLSGVSEVCGACGQCQISDIFTVGNTVAKLILGLSGSIMLLMVIYGGFLWLSSGGNSAMVDKGKKVLIGSIIGLIIVFGAYTSTQFILGALGVTNVAEVFTRPFQNAKGKVEAPTSSGTISAPVQAALIACRCIFAATDGKQCADWIKNNSTTSGCDSATPGCSGCMFEKTVSNKTDCTLEKVIKPSMASATGECIPQ